MPTYGGQCGMGRMLRAWMRTGPVSSGPLGWELLPVWGGLCAGFRSPTDEQRLEPTC